MIIVDIEAAHYKQYVRLNTFYRDFPLRIQKIKELEQKYPEFKYKMIRNFLNKRK